MIATMILASCSADPEDRRLTGAIVKSYILIAMLEHSYKNGVSTVLKDIIYYALNTQT